MELNINELYQQYNSTPNNEPISDPIAVQERINYYTRELEQTITDSKDRKLPKWKRELSQNKIQHVRKELKSWQDVYNFVVDELESWHNSLI